ncbi:MAG: NAD(P)-dependent oxidoreductase [Acidimicrobiales bacterium]|nr:NAD(P)-dependent oxidoreductase [Acidimicrobiales bacterium]
MNGSSTAPTLSEMPDRMPPILVIGGTGHIGAALCNFLLDRGHPVTAATRSTHPVFEPPAISRIRVDVTDLTDSAPLAPSATAIICPWVDDSTKGKHSWIGYLLRRLANSGTSSVVYFSTMWVYGTPAEGLLTESTPTAPTNPYATAHLRNESVLMNCAQELGLDVSVLRMANLVGPDPFYQSRSKVSFAHELVDMARRNKVILLRSPPSTPRNILTRTLLHHDLAILLNRTAVEGRVETFNMGGGSTTTMADLARQVAGIAERYDGTPVRVEHSGELIAQPTFHLDTTKIRTLAGSGVDNLTAELELVMEDIVHSHIPVDRTRDP